MPRISDAGYVDQFIKRLDGIPAEAKPAWGKLDKQGLIEHLLWTYAFSTGKIPAPRFIGNWLTEKVLRFLILRGYLSIPKNLKVPGNGKGGMAIKVPGGLPELRKAMQSFIAAKQKGTLTCGKHPAFGDIGPDGWDQLHYLHGEHHMKQFGA